MVSATAFNLKFYLSLLTLCLSLVTPSCFSCCRCRPNTLALVSRDEVSAAKQRLRAVDARPIKKVAEAKARKQRRAQARMQQAKQKADAVAGQEDMPGRAKAREIEKIYAQVR